VLLRTVDSQAQGCVCAALQLGGDVEQPRFMSKYDVIRETGCAWHIIRRGQTNTHTNTDRHAHHNTPLPYQGGEINYQLQSVAFSLVKKGKVFPYSLPSVGPGADPSVQAVSPQVT